jgi:crotonobetainyl-CoA:carnitine CoA-transferase CaiB-like acyl-CoA transferase
MREGNQSINSVYHDLKNPAEVKTSAPEIGQHNEEILLDLGYSWDDIERFKEKGTIA